MTFLRHTVAQLVDPERQHPGLFQFAVEFAELLCKLFPLVGDIGALGRRILGGRGAELLQALLRLAGAGFEFIDSSEGGSEVSAHAALSRAAPEARNALVMVQRTNCRPIASHVRLIVMSASPPGGECHRSAAAGSGYAFAGELSPIPWRAAGARSALIP